MKFQNVKGQVWVETVIYTLIGLAIIGIILAIATPRINEYRDKVVLDQGLDILNRIDTTINDIKTIPGNSRQLEIRIKKGKLIIDSENNKIIYQLDGSRSIYSEPNQEIQVGDINVLTETNGDINVLMTLSYTNLDIQYQDKEQYQELQPGSQPYNLVVKNQGDNDSGNVIINFQ